MIMKNAGKLKKTLKERCPICNKVLQIRTMSYSGIIKGVPFEAEEEYIACSDPNCFYEKELDKKNRKKVRKNKNI